MLLRCDSCKQEKTARGELFSCYKMANLHETFQMLYGVAERWRPDQLRQELNIRDRSRFVAMMGNVGKICQFYLELFFKHSLGRWELLGVDEAATGQAKKPAPEKQSNQQRKVCGGGCPYSSTRKILMALHVDVRVSSSNRSQNWSGWTAGLGCKNVKSGHLNIWRGTLKDWPQTGQHSSPTRTRATKFVALKNAGLTLYTVTITIHRVLLRLGKNQLRLGLPRFATT